MKMNGGVAKADLGAENVEAVRKGCPNLGRHIGNVKGFGVPVVVAINHFYTRHRRRDRRRCKAYVARAGRRGDPLQALGGGLGRDRGPGPQGRGSWPRRRANFAPLYPDEMPLFQKIETIAKRIYHADEVLADKSIRDQLKAWEAAGYGHLPICMAKTQYSFSTDPNLRGAPDGPLGPGARGAAVAPARASSW